MNLSVIVRIVLPRGFFLYHTINTMQQKQTSFFIPGNIPTVSGLLGPTITKMGINFALQMFFFRFSEPVLVFFSLLKSVVIPVSAVIDQSI